MPESSEIPQLDPSLGGLSASAPTGGAQKIRIARNMVPVQDRRQGGPSLSCTSGRQNGYLSASASFVCAVWLASLAATLWLVETYGSTYVPVGDDIHGLFPGVTQPFPEAAE